MKQNIESNPTINIDNALFKISGISLYRFIPYHFISVKVSHPPSTGSSALKYCQFDEYKFPRKRASRDVISG